MVYLTRIEKFNAAHRLWVDHWPEEKNIKIFGKCANKNWHGHNYTLEVTIKGTPDPDTGFIIDARVLSSIVKEHITEPLDHRNLNMDVPFLKDVQPTTENLVKIIWQELEEHLPVNTLHKIKLIETEKIYAEYYGK